MAGRCGCRAERVLGGSSSINGMFYMRGHPLDYREWEKLGASGWGYDGRAAVFPAHWKTSWRGDGKYHGTTGPDEPCEPLTRRTLLHEPLMASATGAGFTNSTDLSAEVAEGLRARRGDHRRARPARELGDGLSAARA